MDLNNERVCGYKVNGAGTTPSRFHTTTLTFWIMEPSRWQVQIEFIAGSPGTGVQRGQPPLAGLSLIQYTPEEYLEPSRGGKWKTSPSRYPGQCQMPNSTLLSRNTVSKGERDNESEQGQAVCPVKDRMKLVEKSSVSR